jgi:ABC-type glycerol-3-phosphate transport system substrate-binding protein
MKKIIITLLCLTLVSLLTTGVYFQTKKITLVFATYDLNHFERERLNNIVNNFKLHNPQVELVIEDIPRDFLTLKNGIRRKKHPYDIFCIPSLLLPNFIRQDLIQPITKYAGSRMTIEGSEIENYFFTGNNILNVMLYNKSFGQLPYKDFLKNADKFEYTLKTVQRRGATYPMMVSTMFPNFSCEPDCTEIDQLDLKRELAEKYYKKLTQERLVYETKSTPWANRYDAFLNGETAFITASKIGLEYIQKHTLGFDIEYIHLSPEYDVYQTTLENCFVIGKNSKNPELAFKFIEFLNNVN